MKETLGVKRMSRMPKDLDKFGPAEKLAGFLRKIAKSVEEMGAENPKLRFHGYMKIRVAAPEKKS